METIVKFEGFKLFGSCKRLHGLCYRKIKIQVKQLRGTPLTSMLRSHLTNSKFLNFLNVFSSLVASLPFLKSREVRSDFKTNTATALQDLIQPKVFLIIE